MMKKTAAFIVAIFMLTTVFAVSAFAIDPFDTEKPLSLHINFDTEEYETGGVTFYLYRVADMKYFGELELREGYEASGAKALTDLTTLQKQELCEKLYCFVTEHEEIVPDDKGINDINGNINFPIRTEKLEPGLYLVRSDRFYLSGESHEIAPFLVSLPYRGEDDVWNYNMSVTPKLADNQVDVEVIWKDQGHEKERPKSVKVELLKGTDRTVYDTVILSEENGWKYSWEDLPGGFEWSVRQIIDSDKYKSTTEKIPGGFRIINTYSPPPEKTLPQTGLLWWPVPALACLGMIAFIIGWSKQRKNEE